MSHINFHPAPGLGDLLPGMFVVPQNPIMDAGTPLVPSVQATAPNQVMRVKHIGELLPGMFVVPQNPIIRTLATGGQTSGMAGLGCGGGCGCGMGDATAAPATSDWTSFFTQSTIIPGIPDGLIYGGGLLAVYMLMSPGGKEYRQKSRALKAQYRGYKRAAAAVA
jgi:hypothetical protein